MVARIQGVQNKIEADVGRISNDINEIKSDVSKIQQGLQELHRGTEFCQMIWEFYCFMTRRFYSWPTRPSKNGSVLATSFFSTIFLLKFGLSRRKSYFSYFFGHTYPGVVFQSATFTTTHQFGDIR
jgi:hypothetical protein